MDRLACVEVPGLPIQTLVHAHPDWRGRPVALVEDDRPHPLVLAVNDEARRAGLRPGQAYATALSCVPALVGGAVTRAAIDGHAVRLCDRLRRFSPGVEPARDMPGLFWVDARGLQHLFPSLVDWARAIRADISAAGFDATVVVGFTRFGTYVVAKSGFLANRTNRERRTGNVEPIQVFTGPESERAVAERVPLTRLDLAPDVEAFLATLGVHTVRDFLSLPTAATRARLGEAAYQLHRLASSDWQTPVQPAPLDPVFERRAEWNAPIADVERLVFLAKRLLDTLMADLTARGYAVGELVCTLALDRGGTQEERIRPAAPTLETVDLVNLLRLRWSACRLPSGATGLHLRVRHEPADAAQQRLMAMRARRTLEAAARAFARLRAAFGEGVVVRARVRDAHLPRARVAWEPVDALVDRAPVPTPVDPRPLVRRLNDAPERVTGASSRTWLREEIASGRVTQVDGPYVVSGGWWRGGVHRDYYFLHTAHGDVQWVYFDRPQRAWFAEGVIE